MSGYINIVDNDGKNMCFKIEDDRILVKYNEIWNKGIKVKGIKFHSNHVYDKA